MFRPRSCTAALLAATLAIAFVPSCAQTRETVKMDDGRELPLYKLETTSESHPFYTGTQKSVDSLGGRVEKFRNKFAHLSSKK